MASKRNIFAIISLSPAETLITWKKLVRAFFNVSEEPPEKWKYKTA